MKQIEQMVADFICLQAGRDRTLPSLAPLAIPYEVREAPLAPL